MKGTIKSTVAPIFIAAHPLCHRSDLASPAAANTASAPRSHIQKRRSAAAHRAARTLSGNSQAWSAGWAGCCDAQVSAQGLLPADECYVSVTTFFPGHAVRPRTARIRRSELLGFWRARMEASGPMAATTSLRLASGERAGCRGREGQATKLPAWTAACSVRSAKRLVQGFGTAPAAEHRHEIRLIR